MSACVVVVLIAVRSLIVVMVMIMTVKEVCGNNDGDSYCDDWMACGEGE